MSARTLTTDVIASRYRVLELVGRGGAAEVYRALDTRLGRVVALKLLHSHLASDPAFAARFEREARAAAGLSHPNIVDVYDYDYDETGGRYFIAMEYVPGQNLKDLVRGGKPLPEPEAGRLLSGVLAGLAAAHEAGVVHRDVKPQNVLVYPDGTPKITDFGIARAAGDAGLTQDGVAFGTPHYLAPEQAQGKPVTSATDVYGAGVIGYEMLSGRVPFDGEDPLSIAYAHVFEAPESLAVAAPGVSPWLVEVVRRAMSKVPGDRYPDAGAMLAAVEAGPVGAAAAEQSTVTIPVVRDNDPEPERADVRAVAVAQPRAVEQHATVLADAGGRRQRPWLLIPIALGIVLLGCLALNPRIGLLSSLGIGAPPGTAVPAPGAAATVPTGAAPASRTPLVAAPETPRIFPTETPEGGASRLGALARPEDVRARTESDSAVQVLWRPPQRGDASAYELQVSRDARTWSPLATVPVTRTSYTHDGLEPGTTYYYRIRTRGPAGPSPFVQVTSHTGAPSGDTPPVAPPRRDPDAQPSDPDGDAAPTATPTPDRRGGDPQPSRGSGDAAPTATPTLEREDGQPSGQQGDAAPSATPTRSPGAEQPSGGGTDAAPTATPTPGREDGSAPRTSTPTPAEGTGGGGAPGNGSEGGGGSGSGGNGEPEPTNTPVPDREPTNTPESEPGPDREPTDTPRPQPTDTPEPEATDTPEPEATDTPEPEATDTPEPESTDTPEPEPEPTDTPEPEPTNTPEPEPTDTPEPEPTNTPEPEPTNTPEPTDTPEPEPTDTPEPEPTDTPEPEPTNTPEPEPTDTPEPEPTDTPEPEPTDTPEPEPTPTSTRVSEPRDTPTPEPEPTDTPEPEPTDTPEPEPTDTPEPEPTDTPEPDPTDTPEPQATATPAPEREASATPEPEDTATPEPEPTDTPKPEPEDTPEPEPGAEDPGVTPDPGDGAGGPVTATPRMLA